MDATQQVTVELRLPPGGPLSGMAADVRAGLTKPFKELSPRYFYDEAPPGQLLDPDGRPARFKTV